MVYFNVVFIDFLFVMLVVEWLSSQADFVFTGFCMLQYFSFNYDVFEFSFFVLSPEVDLCVSRIVVTCVIYAVLCDKIMMRCLCVLLFLVECRRRR